MWFKLLGDQRLNRCTSENCGGQPTWRLESGGIGSDYCSGCKEKITRIVDPRCDCGHLFEICNAPNCP